MSFKVVCPSSLPPCYVRLIPDLPQMLSRVIYGTTTPEPWQCKNLCIRPAVLHDYCRHQVKYADYPGIIAEAGKCVKGTYVTGITDMDIWRLDAFEGGEYKREVVTTKILNDDGTEGEDVECSIYVYRYEHGLVKAEWDFEQFVKEKLHHWVGESKEFAGQSDSDGEEGGRRRGMNSTNQ